MLAPLWDDAEAAQNTTQLASLRDDVAGDRVKEKLGDAEAAFELEELGDQASLDDQALATSL